VGYLPTDQQCSISCSILILKKICERLSTKVKCPGAREHHRCQIMDIARSRARARSAPRDPGRPVLPPRRDVSLYHLFGRRLRPPRSATQAKRPRAGVIPHRKNGPPHILCVSGNLRCPTHHVPPPPKPPSRRSLVRCMSFFRPHITHSPARAFSSSRSTTSSTTRSP
jgi:hypothetical protein